MTTKNDRAALQEQWANTEPAQGGAAPSDVPDGTYEFVVSAVKANLNKYGLRITYRIVGGNEAFIGEEITVQDNLDTAQNMGWFKDRCRRLGIEKDDMAEGGQYADLDSILADGDQEGSIGAALVGKKFEGLKQHKKGFDNVYVNKLLGEADASELADNGGGDAAPEEQAEETPAEAGALDVGSRVTFTSKADGEQAGAIAELFEDKDVQRVRVDADNGKRYNLPLESVTAEEAPAEETPAEETEEVEEEPKKAVAPKAAKKPIPKYPAVKGLKMPEIKALLAGYGLKAETLAQPREFLACVAGMKHSAKYMPDIKELSAACAALGVKKGAKPADTVKLVRAAVTKKFA